VCSYCGGDVGSDLRGVHFLCLSKENEPKERTPLFLARLLAGSLCSSNLPGVKKTRFAQTVFNAYPAAFPVLGGDPMGDVNCIGIRPLCEIFLLLGK